MGQRYGLEIRAASAGDAPGLTALLAAGKPDGIGPAADSVTVAARLDAAARAGGSVLIAIEWGPPSGVVALQIVHDIAAPRPAGLITSLIVDRDARRRGIGRLLVKAVSRSARLAGCDRLLLAADGEAEGLLDFAAATGFSPEGGFLVRPLLRRGATAD